MTNVRAIKTQHPKKTRATNQTTKGRPIPLKEVDKMIFDDKPNDP
jgi:hypothetical protein